MKTKGHAHPGVPTEATKKTSGKLSGKLSAPVGSPGPYCRFPQELRNVLALVVTIETVIDRIV